MALLCLCKTIFLLRNSEIEINLKGRNYIKLFSEHTTSFSFFCLFMRHCWNLKYIILKGKRWINIFYFYIQYTVFSQNWPIISGGWYYAENSHLIFWKILCKESYQKLMSCEFDFFLFLFLFTKRFSCCDCLKCVRKITLVIVLK